MIDFKVVSDRKSISINYIKGWFFVDIVSIIPFDEFFKSGDDVNSSKFHKLARVARIGRL